MPESEGLMILTNDGDMTNKLSHPRYEHTKTYKVTVYGKPDGETLGQMGKWRVAGWRAGCTVFCQGVGGKPQYDHPPHCDD